MATLTDEEKECRTLWRRIEKRFAKGVVEYGLIEDASNSKRFLGSFGIAGKACMYIQTFFFGGGRTCGDA